MDTPCGLLFRVLGNLSQLGVTLTISSIMVAALFILYQIYARKKELPLSIPEVGYGQPIPNESTSTSDDGSVSGTRDGTSSDGGERSRSARTAIMEVGWQQERNYQNLQNNYHEENIRTSPGRHNRLYEEFEDITRISQGAFGHVIKGKKILENKYYAIKIVPQRNNDEEALLEVKVLAHVEHKNIVRFYTAWRGESEISSYPPSSERGRGMESCLFIQMELCAMSLEKWIWRRNADPTQIMDKDQSLQLFSQIIDGIYFIHCKNYMHRDLKPANIFLTEEMIVKIGDFGLVRGEDEGQRKWPRAGTLAYMAPEQKGIHYGKEVDIFPLGLIFYELLWKGATRCNRKTWDHIRSGDFPAEFGRRYPDEAHAIKKMLSRDPEKRPSAGDLRGILYLIRQEASCGRWGRVLSDFQEEIPPTWDMRSLFNRKLHSSQLNSGNSNYSLEGSNFVSE